MALVRKNYGRDSAEKRFARVYETVEGDTCIYCGMPNDGAYDHQPPVYILHRFAGGSLVTKREIRDNFGQCKLVPCCTICNMGLGAYHGKDDNDRRQEILNWFLCDDRYPEDRVILEIGYGLLRKYLDGAREKNIYVFPGVGRAIYIESLGGLIQGKFGIPDDFPDWLKLTQSELADWLRETPKRKSQYFLEMANLQSYDLLPHARSDPRGQFE
jgi:hypothetical protein